MTIKDLVETYRQFPEWFIKQYKGVKCIEIIDFNSLYGASPYMFQFNFYDLRIRIKLSFDRFQDIYYKDGKENITDTYYILTNKMYDQFLTEVQREFEKKIKGSEQYE